MEFSGVSSELRTDCKIKWFIAIFIFAIGYVLLMYTFLDFVNSDDKTISVGMIVGMAIIMLNTVNVLIAAGRSSIINVIGKHTKVKMDENGVHVLAKFQMKKMTRSFAWSEIDDITTAKRRFLRNGKRTIRIIQFRVDQTAYDELKNKYIYQQLYNKRRAELLDCYFEMEYRPEVMREIERYWDKPIEDRGIVPF